MGQTADQIRSLANLFSTMSETVESFRSQHYDELAPEERSRLASLFQKLCDIHDEFTALAIQSTLDSIQSDLAQIVSVTSEAQHSLQHLKTIAEITSLVSAAAQLGADITTGDYGAIPHALKDLVKAIPKSPGLPTTSSSPHLSAD